MQADMSLRDLSKQTGGLTAAFPRILNLDAGFRQDDALARLASTLGTTSNDLRKYDTRPPSMK
jgi:hypothetical protein